MLFIRSYQYTYIHQCCILFGFTTLNSGNSLVFFIRMEYSNVHTNFQLARAHKPLKLYRRRRILQIAYTMQTNTRQLFVIRHSIASSLCGSGAPRATLCSLQSGCARQNAFYTESNCGWASERKENVLIQIAGFAAPHIELLVRSAQFMQATDFQWMFYYHACAICGRLNAKQQHHIWYESSQSSKVVCYAPCTFIIYAMRTYKQTRALRTNTHTCCFIFIFDA